MSKRDDFLAALDCQRPLGAVPIWEIEFQAWDAASGRHVVLGREFEALTPPERERALHANAEILLATCADLQYAALTTPNAYWHAAPGQLAYYVMPGDTRFAQLEILRRLAPRDLALVANAGGILGADYSEEFCVRLFEDPESIDRQAESTLSGGLETARRFRDAGADVIMSASDIADNSGPFFSPTQMERWVYPYLDRWADAIHALGLRCILHTDGQLARYMDRIAATRLDAIQAIDPVAGMDMRRTKDIVGDRLCLCGNIDCGLLLLGTPDEIYAATAHLLTTCKNDGGLVLGASNAVQADVPLANYRAMIRAWQDHGTYTEVAGP
jgi:hypothetical protein